MAGKEKHVALAEHALNLVTAEPARGARRARQSCAGDARAECIQIPAATDDGERRRGMNRSDAGENLEGLEDPFLAGHPADEDDTAPGGMRDGRVAEPHTIRDLDDLVAAREATEVG